MPRTVQIQPGDSVVVSGQDVEARELIKALKKCVTKLEERLDTCESDLQCRERDLDKANKRIRVLERRTLTDGIDCKARVSKLEDQVSTNFNANDHHITQLKEQITDSTDDYNTRFSDIEDKVDSNFDGHSGLIARIQIQVAAKFKTYNDRLIHLEDELTKMVNFKSNTSKSQSSQNRRITKLVDQQALFDTQQMIKAEALEHDLSAMKEETKHTKVIVESVMAVAEKFKVVAESAKSRVTVLENRLTSQTGVATPVPAVQETSALTIKAEDGYGLHSRKRTLTSRRQLDY